MKTTLENTFIGKKTINGIEIKVVSNRFVDRVFGTISTTERRSK